MYCIVQKYSAKGQKKNLNYFMSSTFLTKPVSQGFALFWYQDYLNTLSLLSKTKLDLEMLF